MCLQRIKIRRLKDPCDICSSDMEQKKCLLLEKKGHKCLRKPDFHLYHYIQWCGSPNCRRSNKNTVSPSSEYILILHDIQLNSDKRKRKPERYCFTTQLTQMNFENWLQLDDCQDFRTFTEAIQGYSCSVCISQSSETNRIFMHSDSAFRLCTNCVRMTQKSLASVQGKFSLQKIFQMYTEQYFYQIMSMINMPLVLSALCFAYLNRLLHE